ncbi:MAG: hypothetical protein GY757_12760 [bacterium]|nr:hypothetical protein [bacterium]
MKERFRKVYKEKDITYILSQALGYALNENSIKKMERLKSHPRMGGLVEPLWEITMADENIYYYSIISGLVYEADRIVPWKANKRGGRPSTQEVVQHWDYLPDSINDEIIVLKTVTNK